MDYPIHTPTQLKAVLRALRRARGRTQEDVGRQLGVNQKRIARIEGAPQLASFDQISRLIAILGGRLVIQDTRAERPETGGGKKRRGTRPAATKTDPGPHAMDW